MRRYILGLLVLFSNLNILFCMEYLNKFGLTVTIMQIILSSAVSVSIIACIVSLKEISKNNEWIIKYYFLLISLFSFIFTFKFGLIMIFLSVIYLLIKNNN